MNKQKSTYLLVVIFSVFFLFAANKIATNEYPFLRSEEADSLFKATVVSVQPFDGSAAYTADSLAFQAKLLNGPQKDQIVSAMQPLNVVVSSIRLVETGDKILLLHQPGSTPGEFGWHYIEHIRSNAVLYLAIAFAVALLLFGRMKGLNILLSLAFTFIAIFAVLLPAILSGKNIYYWSLLISLFIVVMTLFITNGINAKSFATILGCLGGIFIAGLLMLLMDAVIKLTGIVSEDSIYLLYLKTNNPIDLKAIVFASVIIGAIGAIMDIAMDISASLHEIKSKVTQADAKTLLHSGMTIGRDILGTMANTLILAYIGSSLSVVLLLLAYNQSLIHLLNREMVIVEMLQMLIGSFGILSTIPLTSYICAKLFTKTKKRTR